MRETTYETIVDEINTMTDEEYNKILAEAKEMDEDVVKNILWEKVSVV